MRRQFHSAYSRDGFYFRYFDILDAGSRAQLAGVIGADAEHAVCNYCSTVDLWDASEFGGEAAVMSAAAAAPGADSHRRHCHLLPPPVGPAST